MINPNELRFLVVDDYESFKSLNMSALKRFYPGCTLETGNDGTELVNYKGKCNLYITDHNMQCMNGLDALIERRRNNDFTPAIIVTGNIAEIEKRRNEIPANTYLLEKPYQLTALKDLVNHVLSAHYSNIPSEITQSISLPPQI